MIDDFQNEVDRVKDDQIAKFEIAMQEWGESLLDLLPSKRAF